MTGDAITLAIVSLGFGVSSVILWQGIIRAKRKQKRDGINGHDHFN